MKPTQQMEIKANHLAECECVSALVFCSRRCAGENALCIRKIHSTHKAQLLQNRHTS